MNGGRILWSCPLRPNHCRLRFSAVSVRTLEGVRAEHQLQPARFFALARSRRRCCRAPLMRFLLPSAFTGRAACAGDCHIFGLSRFGVIASDAGRIALTVLRLPAVSLRDRGADHRSSSDSVSRFVRPIARRVIIRRWSSFAATFQIRSSFGRSHDLAGICAVTTPATLMGFAYPSQC